MSTICPQWGLMWSEAGSDAWTCVGLYDTRQEAIDAFDLWTHVRAGRLSMVALEETETRDVDRYGSRAALGGENER